MFVKIQDVYVNLNLVMEFWEEEGYFPGGENQYNLLFLFADSQRSSFWFRSKERRDMVIAEILRKVGF